MVGGLGMGAGAWRREAERGNFKRRWAMDTSPGCSSSSPMDGKHRFVPETDRNP